jgi:GH24 family phage-related lysozyme (muramidase)
MNTRFFIKLFIFAFIFNNFLKAEDFVLETRSFLIQWEGYKNKVYKGKGKNEKTVGIGHYFFNNPSVKIGEHYTDKQINNLFYSDYAHTVDFVSSHVKEFHSLPKDVKKVLISIGWTTGKTGFAKFKKMIAHINKRDFVSASKELKNSLWYKQVGKNRGNNHILLLKNANNS